MRASSRVLAAACVAAVLFVPARGAHTAQDQGLPNAPITYREFVATFAADGAFSLEGPGWPAFRGTWTARGYELTLRATGGPPECAAPGRYRLGRDGTAYTFAVIEDGCRPRRMILDRSSWRRGGDPPPIPERRIVRTGPETPVPLSAPAPARGSWPSFRGHQASGVADGQDLPDTWNGPKGEHILWRTRISGLAHSSPIVWGNRIFVTTAVSSRNPNASFKPGLYGDGDASDDRSPHRWILYALDKQTGEVLWERVAFEGEPRDKRHIKSTYASASPATDGRLVVAWFGSQGVHAYDLDGTRLWQVDLGRVDMGAYDIPAFEWGPASSPIIWNGRVILQVDTQADSFLLALDAATGKMVWKTERDELPSWGTPTVATTEAGPVLVANASNYIRGYDPATGQELWRLGGSSKITAPTPIFANGLFIIASGRLPERPIFAVRPGARGDLTLARNRTRSDAIPWSRTGRGSYMPTPIVYEGVLYVLANNGVLDAYDVATGKEIYRQRLQHLGSGFSASPVAADGKLYLANEDGDILVVRAGRRFEHIATNDMGELLMATPALSEGRMFVRGVNTLFAIGRR
jgi:outer membrane protein assembly factor BamB